MLLPHPTTPRLAFLIFAPSLTYPIDLPHVIVNEAEGFLLVLLDHDGVPAVPPLAVDLLEAPDLPGLPALGGVLGLAEEVGAVGVLPARLEVLVLDLGELDEAALAADVAEEPVRVLAVDVVEAAVLVRGGEARGRLGDVDVRHHVRRGAGRLGGRLVLVHLDDDAGDVDGLAEEVAQALEGEGRVGRVRELLVLE